MQHVLKEEQSKVSLYSNMLLILTSVHHVYGGIIYHTPWRFHVLFLSVPVILVTTLLHYLLKKQYNGFLFWAYWALTLLASVLFIGVFEGLYNHVLKNMLYFSGMPHEAMVRIFPPGMYEMPNDAFFEITGTLQGVITVILISYFVKLTRAVMRRNRG